MAFNPQNYKAPAAKKLPVILLLDVSGSMSGEKIRTLYDSVVQMVHSFVAAQAKETIIDVAIITFGNEVRLHTSYTGAARLQDEGVQIFEAGGMTPLGTALQMAKDMIEDKSVTPSNIYRPAVIIVSDGLPNDSWQQPLSNFIREGRSAKCQRFAIAIGSDADQKMLETFTGGKDTVFVAEDAAGITDCFRKFTMSVSARAVSQNPNKTSAISSILADDIQQDTDDDDYI